MNILERIKNNDTFIKTVYSLPDLENNIDCNNTRINKLDESETRIHICTFKKNSFKFLEKEIKFITSTEPDGNKKTALENVNYNELYANVLLKSIIFQEISPHFNVHYCWKFEEPELALSLYTEYIDGVLFSDWMKDGHSNNEWYCVFFQLLYSLVVIKKHLNLIHGDLHTENIMIRKIPSGDDDYFKYTINKRDYYIPNLGWQIIIIDFGFAYIPGKLGLNWYYNDVFSKLDEHNLEFFDLYKLTSWLLGNEVPQIFKTHLLLNTDETNFIITNKLLYSGTDNSERFHNIITKIKKQYTFGKKVKTTLVELLESLYREYTVKPVDAYTVVESYDCDKELDKTCISGDVKYIVKK